MESLKNAYDILVRNVLGWLHLVVEFHDSDQASCMIELWSMCFSDARWVAEAIELNIIFDKDRGKLYVAAEFDGSDGIFDRLNVFLVQLWQFRTFSDSRWLTFGSSARTLLASMLLGLEEYVRYCLDVKHCSRYYLSGFLRFDDQMKHLVALASTSSFVSDNTLSMCFEDDRLAVRINDIDAGAQDELDYVFSLSQGVWDAIGRVSGMDSGILRAASLRAALVSHAYFTWRTYDVRLPPWSLASGCLDSNLDAVLAGPEPRHPFMKQLHGLLSAGYPRAQLRALLELLGQASKSNNVGEQGHSAASVIKRQHPDYDACSVQSRAQLVSFAPLLRQDVTDLRIHRLRNRLLRLGDRHPEHFTGRQALLSDLSRLRSHCTQAGLQSRQDGQHRIVRKHAQIWGRMPDGQKAFYEREAGRRRSVMQEDLADARDDVIDQLASARQQRKHELEEQPCMRLGACRLDENQKARLSALAASGKYTAEYVQERIRQSQQPVGPPPEPVREMLQNVGVPPSLEAALRPPWLSFVCHHRVFFEKCAFRWRVGEDGDWKMFFFLFALQNPFVVGFVGLEELHNDTAAVWFANESESSFSFWLHVYSVKTDQFFFTDVVGHVHAESSVEVLADCWLQRNAYLTSDAQWQNMEEMQEMLGDVSETSAQAPEKVRVATHAELEPWVDLPWLLDAFNEKHGFEQDSGCAASSAKKQRHAVELPVAGEAELPDAGDDFDIDDVMDWLRGHRSAMDDGAPESHEFMVFLRGGPTTYARLGVPYYCWRAHAMSGDPSDFAVRFSLGKTSDYHISAYGDEVAHVMASAWVHRMSFLYRTWVGADRPAHMDWATVLAGYVEPPALAALDADASFLLRRRLATLRGLCPM